MTRSASVIQRRVRIYRLIEQHICPDMPLPQWSCMTITHKLADKLQDVKRAVSWLVGSGYITEAWGTTTDGERWYLEQLEKPEITQSLLEWRDEALTGITRDGQRSSLQWAALHKTEKHQPSDRTDHIEFVRAVEKIMKEQKLNIMEFSSLYADGLIAWCDACKKVSIFHKNGHGGRRKICRQCRSKKRREK